MIVVFGIIIFTIGMVFGGLVGFVAFALVTAIGRKERENCERYDKL